MKKQKQKRKEPDFDPNDPDLLKVQEMLGIGPFSELERERIEEATCELPEDPDLKRVREMLGRKESK